MSLSPRQPRLAVAPHGAALALCLWLACILRLASGATGKELNCDLIKDEVCYIKRSVKMRSIIITRMDLDVVIDDDVEIYGAASVRISTTKKLTIGRNVQLIAGNLGLSVFGGRVEVLEGALLESKYITVGDPPHSKCMQLNVSGARAVIRSLLLTQISCPKGQVLMVGKGARIETNAMLDTTAFKSHVKSCEDEPDGHPDLAIKAHGAKFGSQFQIKANIVRIITQQNLTLAAKMQDGTRLHAKAGQTLRLGAEQSSWNLCSIRAIGDKVHVETGHAISTEDTTIVANKEVETEDLCTTALDAAKDLNVLVRHMDNKRERAIFFDAAIIGLSEVHLHDQSRLWVAGLLVCARHLASFGSGVLLKTSGRGWGPGSGRGAGDTNLHETCGAGGASSFDRGGSGVEYTASSVTVCAPPGYRTKAEASKSSEFSFEQLPTMAASGGGCGVAYESCQRLQKDKQHPSAGGGIIWLSADELRTKQDVHISADGSSGVLVKESDADGVSGGGAGGQIVMFLRALVPELPSPLHGDSDEELASISDHGGVVVLSDSDEDNDQTEADLDSVSEGEDVLVLSAKGGNAACDTDNNIASGAGAGGFVGIRWTSIDQEGDGVKVSVGGGDLTAECDEFVPHDKQGRSDLRGLPGIAASLTKCRPGRAGVFCEMCPAGKWVDGGLQCMDCVNKPALRARYTESGWTNSDCPYQCTNGVEPDCFCPAGSIGDFCEACGVGTWSAFGTETCEPCANKPGGDNSAYTTSGWHNETCPYTCRSALMLTDTCQCPAGYAGNFCDECPIGKWSMQGSEVCQDCKNKPGPWALYTARRWPSPDCPFNCAPGVPKVNVNPNCDCPAGHAGILCGSCPIGQWSPINSLVCQACDNKPGHSSEYFARAWPNNSCPYKCTPDVFDVSHNPKCLSPIAFAINFYGGIVTISILFGLASISGMLLLCFQGRNFGSNREREREGDRSGQFVHEKLPYHICRIYVCGQNSPTNSWFLGRGAVPGALKDLVDARMWENFASEFNWCARVDFSEGGLLPLINPFKALLRRRRRAEALVRLVRSCSEGKDGGQAIWSDHKGDTHALQMIFSCDRGATLGYIDFFDRSLELYDWKPVDLRKEARFLVAHGLGTYIEPWALEVGDPLVEQLAQTTFGAVAVYEVVFTFNRLARLVPRSELAEDTRETPALEMLEAEVSKCAHHCGVGGVARVCIIPQDRTPHVRRQDGHPRRELSAMEASFSEMIRQFPSSSGLSEISEDSNADAPRREESRTGFQQRTGPELRLCLLFLDSSHTRECDAGRMRESEADLTPEGATVPAHLTSPLTHEAAASVAIGPCASERRNLGAGAWSLGGTRSEASSVEDWPLAVLKALRLRLLRYETNPTSCMLQGLASLCAAPLLLLDALVGVLTVEVLARKGPVHLLLYLMLPPLAPALAAISGFAFLAMDRPRLGRWHRAVVVLSIANSVVACLVLALYHSFFMLLQELPLVCFSKILVLLCAEVRIHRLEARSDLMQSFTKVRDHDSIDAADAASFRAILRDLSARFSPRPGLVVPSHRARVLRRGAIAESHQGGICLTAASSWVSAQQAPLPNLDQQSSGSVDSLRLTFIKDSPDSEDHSRSGSYRDGSYRGGTSQGGSGGARSPA